MDLSTCLRNCSLLALLDQYLGHPKESCRRPCREKYLVEGGWLFPWHLDRSWRDGLRWWSLSIKFVMLGEEGCAQSFLHVGHLLFYLCDTKLFDIMRKGANRSFADRVINLRRGLWADTWLLGEALWGRLRGVRGGDFGHLRSALSPSQPGGCSLLGCCS